MRTKQFSKPFGKKSGLEAVFLGFGIWITPSLVVIPIKPILHRINLRRRLLKNIILFILDKESYCISYLRKNSNPPW